MPSMPQLWVVNFCYDPEIDKNRIKDAQVACLPFFSIDIDC